MEIWEEIYENAIPKGNYCTSIKNGEISGLSIELESSEYIVKIYFGAVSALRMLDEGVLLKEIFCEDAVRTFKDKKFSNIIYKIKGGEFDKFVKSACNELFDYLDLKHFIVVTMNYVIEIITEWEPSIEVNKKL